MISPQQAHEIISRCRLRLSAESVRLEAALHRILAEDLIADQDLPPFDRVMMDGIAVAFQMLEDGQTSFVLEGIQRAGEPIKRLQNEQHALEVMTGAVRPQGTDTVIPYEHLTITNGVARVEVVPATKGKNIHRRASDKIAGDCLASAGGRMGAAEIGIAASIGKTEIQVQRLPRIAICSTGDELVPITETPLPYQIRRSNVYALQALMQAQGFTAELHHLPDETHALTIGLEKLIETNDILLLSGGVSKGKFDLIPEVLQSLGIDCLFHRVAQKPGKPMWFGRSERCIVFAFPGNPVSTLACAARYLLPWIQSQQGFYCNQWVEVKEEIKLLEKLTQFIPVRYVTNGEIRALEIIRNQGSGDFSALNGACGFIEVPAVTDVNGTKSRFRFFPMA